MGRENRTLHGRLGKRILPSSAESISHEWAKRTSERCFQREKRKFVSPSGHEMFLLFYRYWWNSYIIHNCFFFHFRNSKILQLKWSPIAKCLSQKCYETRIKSYKVEIKTIILMFLFQRVKILMKKRKIMLVTMATPISSHVKNKNSIFTARNEDMIFW